MRMKLEKRKIDASNWCCSNDVNSELPFVLLAFIKPLLSAGISCTKWLKNAVDIGRVFCVDLLRGIDLLDLIRPTG